MVKHLKRRIFFGTTMSNSKTLVFSWCQKERHEPPQQPTFSNGGSDHAPRWSGRLSWRDKTYVSRQYATRTGVQFDIFDQVWSDLQPHKPLLYVTDDQRADCELLIHLSSLTVLHPWQPTQKNATQELESRGSVVISVNELQALLGWLAGVQGQYEIVVSVQDAWYKQAFNYCGW